LIEKRQQGTDRQTERERERERERDSPRPCCKHVTDNVYAVIFIRAAISRTAQDGGRREEKGGGSATFIIKSRLLAFTMPRNGKIQDLRSRQHSPRRAPCSPLSLLSTRSAPAEGGGKSKRDSKLCSQLLRLETDARHRHSAALLNHMGLWKPQRGLTTAGSFVRNKAPQAETCKPP